MKKPRKRSGTTPSKYQPNPARAELPKLSITQTVGWSGPVPSPAALAQFNELVPNGAERIVAMAEKEQVHRIGMESDGQSAAVKEARRGQYLGGAISLAAVLGTVALGLLGVDWKVCVALVSVPVLTAVIAIVNRKSAR